MFDCGVDFADVIDVVQDQSGAVSRGGTDDDIAAAEELLDQCLCITDTLNFIQAERLAEADQYAAFTADSFIRNDIELIFAQ